MQAFGRDEPAVGHDPLTHRFALGADHALYHRVNAIGADQHVGPGVGTVGEVAPHPGRGCVLDRADATSAELHRARCQCVIEELLEL